MITNYLTLGIYYFFFFLGSFDKHTAPQQFQGKAFIFQKQNGIRGVGQNERSPKEANKNRLKNRLEKTYILTFNRDESIFYEEEKVDAISGATDSWGSNFMRVNNTKMFQRINWFNLKNFMEKILLRISFKR